MKNGGQKTHISSSIILHTFCLCAVFFYAFQISKTNVPAAAPKPSTEPLPSLSVSADPALSAAPLLTTAPTPSVTSAVQATAAPAASVTPSNPPVPSPSFTPTPTPIGVSVMRINTDDKAPVSSKLEYVHGSMDFDGETYSLQIKGRGNSSWNTFPKKSYRIKLDEKASLAGLPADKDYSLACNYVDPTLIRNAVTLDMSKIMTRLEWTPDLRYCELYLNDEYIGLYTLHEKIEDSAHKIDLGTAVTDEKGKILDGGFIIEWGWDYDSENIYGRDYFMTNSGDSLYVKDPKITMEWEPAFRYAYNYVKAAEKAIETNNNYEEYIDVDNWVDWFIINELTNNTECSFYRSLYMYKKPGGKLCLGPLWDYDTAFGNHTADIADYDGWVSCDSTYRYMLKPDMIYYLMLDESFSSKIKKRWAEVKEDLLSAALYSIDANRILISDYIDKNFEKWPRVLSGKAIGSGRATTYGFTTYEEQIDYLRTFVLTRYQWMDNRLTSKAPLTTPKPTPAPSPTPAPEETPEPVSENEE